MNNSTPQLPTCLKSKGYDLKSSGGKWWVENKNRYIISDKLYSTSNEAIDNAIIKFTFAKYAKDKPRWYYVV